MDTHTIQLLAIDDGSVAAMYGNLPFHEVANVAIDKDDNIPAEVAYEIIDKARELVNLPMGIRIEFEWVDPDVLVRLIETEIDQIVN